ncbi:glycoside hydrolase family 78 protein [Aspergillus carbonarius ITEM 5010]|uniref:Glycoside hydrolase family 78 protein n=1 Tax=Aspergillus carbonarius (strain ITEM 5010) TaxID=602072 RepID=A0A1R3RRI5_ASPC5|nr:glycoside hydrolase family 78 protein [Aspergillus carbonarius ITEM 5010]
MRWPNVLSGVLALLPFSAAQSCWRDTTCSGPTDTAFPGPWEENIFAPSSRTLNPEKLFLISQPSKTADYAPFALHGNGSLVVYDFGKEVGGIVSVNFSSTGSGALGVAFTEAKNWIGEWSDSSNGGFKGPDGALYGNFTEAGSHYYVMPDKYLRGGFRYLTLFLITSGNVSAHIEDVSLEIGFQPTWSNLKAYQGYFHSDDDLLNKIWYTGAYTLQTNEVPTDTGRQIPAVAVGWANNATLGYGDTIIVDGAKRDRAVWPGDMGIAVPSAFVSLGNLESVRNALQIMYDTQNNSTGAFDESGPPLSQKDSDTYHMWTMVGTYNYMLFTNDSDFLETNWAGYQRAMDYIYGKLATWAGDSGDLSDTWTSRAAKLREAINEYCWDEAYGAFKDNATDTTLHPQDANSMALLFGVVDDDRAASISERLTDNWTPIGAVAPELPENISPFISSFEIQGHLTVGQPARALELIRRSWGWYYNNPNGTQSTVIEGYLQNGTFGYRWDRGYYDDTAYVSHSHGWSSGPTSALTNYIVGITVTSPLGATWRIAPQFVDLQSAEAGFTTSLGTFQAGWSRTSTGYTLDFTVPQGTKGNLTLPYISAAKPTIQIDGTEITRGVQYANQTATMPPIPTLQLRTAARAHTSRLTRPQCLRQPQPQSRLFITPRAIRNTSTSTSTSTSSASTKNPLRTTSPRNREQDLARTKRSMLISASGMVLCAVGMYAVIKSDVFGLESTTKGSDEEATADAEGEKNPNGAMKLDGPGGFPNTPAVTIIHGQEEGVEVETGTSSVPYFPSVIRLPRWIEGEQTPVGSGEEIKLTEGDKEKEEEYHLLGLGIRTVSFLHLQVYVVGMYVAKSDLAELQSRLVRTAVHPPHVEEGGEKVIANEVGAAAATSLVSMEREKLRDLLLDQAERGDEAWEGILKENGLRTAFRIVPTRNTDFLHLRDGWVRGITGRAKKYNAIASGAAGAGGEFEGEAFGEAMGVFKGLFSGAGQKNVPKGQTLVLARGSKGQLDVLVWGDKGNGRYMGRVADERISRLVWLNYLAGKNVSSEGARRSVVDGIMGVVERPVGTV